LKLEQLQLDFEVVAFADVSSLKLNLADIDRLLKALEVFEGEIEGRFGEQNGNELLADIEGEGAFSVRNLGAGDGGLIAGGLETMLPFCGPRSKR